MVIIVEVVAAIEEKVIISVEAVAVIIEEIQ